MEMIFHYIKEEDYHLIGDIYHLCILNIESYEVLNFLFFFFDEIIIVIVIVIIKERNISLCNLFIFIYLNFQTILKINLFFY